MAGSGSGEGGSSTGFSIGGSQFTDSSTASIPIMAPPGRSAATTPQITLAYSSSKGNGFTGMGWDIHMGRIELRDYREGFMESFTNFEPNRFFLVDGGSSRELTFEKEDKALHENVWRLKVQESIAPMIRSWPGKIHGANPTELKWMVTAADGAKHYYGTTENSRVINYQNWVRECIPVYYLDRVEDANGNVMEIQYFADPEDKVHPQKYPHLIKYSSHINGTPASNYILFTWEPREDKSHKRDNPKMRLRLKTIDVFSGVNQNIFKMGKLSDKLAARYVLDYHYADETGYSLLTSVRRYGSDGATEMLPRIGMTYKYMGAEAGCPDGDKQCRLLWTVTNGMGGRLRSSTGMHSRLPVRVITPR